MPYRYQKKIAIINDFCGFGRCTITAALPIISAMKMQCCPLPTSIFSNHTGYDSFFMSDFTDKMDMYIEEWVKLGLRFDGILSGYLASHEQIHIVKKFFDIFKTENTVTVIDPVMGDNGKLYTSFSRTLAVSMAELLPYADILTPNLTEACILTDTEYDNKMNMSALETICEKLCDMGAKSVVISGVDRGEYLENIVFDGKYAEIVHEQKTGPCYSGTGDVFSAIIAADAVKDVPLLDSVKHASAFVAKSLGYTASLHVPEADGLCFEEFLSEL